MVKYVRPVATISWLPFVALLALVLFPLGWLGDVWPLFGRGLHTILPTVLVQSIGHAALFCALGFGALWAFPALAWRPWPYLGLLLLIAFGQEAIQALHSSIGLDDGLDLLADLTGGVVALLVIRRGRLACGIGPTMSR